MQNDHLLSHKMDTPISQNLVDYVVVEESLSIILNKITENNKGSENISDVHKNLSKVLADLRVIYEPQRIAREETLKETYARHKVKHQQEINAHRQLAAKKRNMKRAKYADRP